MWQSVETNHYTELIMTDIPEDYKQLGYIRESASAATIEIYEWVLKNYGLVEHKMRFPMSSAPMVGISVQHATALRYGLQDYDPMLGQQMEMNIDEAIRHGIAKFDEYKPRTWDDGKDAEAAEAYRETLPDLIRMAVLSVGECFAQANLLEGEYQRWMHVDGLKVPVVLYQDFSAGGMQADLKCSVSQRNPVKKDGTRTWRVPKPKKEPTWNQIKQQAVYWKATGQMPSLLFVTARDYHIANSQNCEQLTEASLERAYNDVVRTWKIHQNLVEAANGSWRKLAGLVDPDFNEIARKHGSTWLEIAKQLWR